MRCSERSRQSVGIEKSSSEKGRSQKTSTSGHNVLGTSQSEVAD